MVYFINYHNIFSWELYYTDMVLTQVHKLYRHCDMEEAHTDPNVVPTVHPKDWPKHLEMVVEYISEFCVVDGNPLSYFLTDDLVPPSELTYPDSGNNNSNYFTCDDEIIAHGK